MTDEERKGCLCGQVHSHPPTYDELWRHAAWAESELASKCAEVERYRNANISLDRAAKEQLSRAEEAESRVRQLEEAVEWACYNAGRLAINTDRFSNEHAVFGYVAELRRRAGKEEG